MENDEKQSKWMCDQCTYLNYNKSIRCVMCSYPKSAVEIFSLSPTPQTAITPLVETISESPMNSDESQRKLCNSPRNNTKRDTITTASLVEEVKKLEIRTSDPDLSSKCKASSPLASSSNLTKDPEHNNRKSEVKWQCMACTYENYPRSIKCSMCATKRDTTNSQKIISNENEYIENLDDLISGASNFNMINSLTASEDSYTVKNNLKNLPNNYEIASSNNNNNNCGKYQLSSNELEAHQERRIRQLKRQADWSWLNACIGVVENNLGAVEHYLARGGNVARALTSNEVILLNRPSAFDIGHTLIHLAIRFHRDELLPRLLAQISSNGPSGIKCVPSHIAPDIATDIRRHFGQILRIRKAPFNCNYVNEHATFSLPADIEELPLTVQEQLYEELLDRDAQKQLENPPPALNWSLEITSRLGSRLMVLWNRSAGDCLLDSCMQSTWGVFDRDNILRRALSDSLHQCGNLFYPRWKEYEMIQAALLHFTLEETQWEEGWSTLLSLASQPGASLEQLHIFVLAHIFRRPIIVYGVKYVKSFRGEDIGYARFEGLYLPLLWEQSFCIRSPIALGYTRGHFSALVPSEPYQRLDSAREEEEDVTFLPLMDCENKLIPIHFLSQSEMGHEETIMKTWLDVCFTEGGLMVAQQKLHKRPLLVAQMLEEWLNHYRRIA
ncbi:CLUMA_CG009236, isoform A [Clunio marinus]|uniref:ubiquitinyl hydrolase 1 n=1 Tax=Clunio marinus TaxID=568069 RepID=A0A1J1I6F5_9DIPT|nr:CLUMA_CG009236, isoform A [Clunio marinus]